MKLEVKTIVQMVTDARKRALEENEKFVDKYIATASDELTVVLRSHLYFESLIGKLVNLAIPESAECTSLSFSKKVKLLNALGFDKPALKSVTLFNTLRNKFAHDLAYKLSEQDLSKVWKGFEGTNLNVPAKNLFAAIGHIGGLLHALIVIESYVPAYSAISRNPRILNDDPLFRERVDLSNYLDAIDAIQKGFLSADSRDDKSCESADT